MPKPKPISYDELMLVVLDMQTVLSALELNIDHMRHSICEHLDELDASASTVRDAYEWLEELVVSSNDEPAIVDKSKLN